MHVPRHGMRAGVRHAGMVRGHMLPSITQNAVMRDGVLRAC